LSDKDFKVKNKLVINGLTQTGPLVADANKQVDATPYLTTLQGGTGTTTSPSSGQILYSSSGTTYTPTTLSSLDVKGATYSDNAPASPFVGQVWIESDSSSDSFDPNIMRRKTITATAGQTTFTTDLEFIQGYEQVYFNGMLLLRTTDYTTPSNTSVVLAAAAAAGDIVEILSITNLNSINAATTTTNTFTGNQIFQAQVGMGSSNPGGAIGDERLRVVGTDTNGWPIAVEDSAGTVAGGFYAASNLFGMGTASTDPLTLITANTERMRIDSSGNVGIGTSAPQGRLHVYTGASGNNYSQFTVTQRIENNGDSGLGIHTPIANNAVINHATPLDGGSASIIFNGQSRYMSFHTVNGTERMRIDSLGNVGIGYAAPNTKLEIRSTSAVVDSYGLVTIGSNNFGVDNGGSLSFAGVTSSDNNQSNFVPYAQISGRKENSTSGNYAGYLSFATRIHTGALTERMRIISNGGVSVQSGNILYLQNPVNTGAGSVFCPGGGSLSLASYNQTMILLNEDNSILFKVGSGTDRARFDSNGYLLIGYTSSNGAYRLQVNSQIFATSSSIATSDGRYKENVDTITSGLNIVDSLRPVSFTWKEHPVHNFVAGKTVGFIAQEVQEALSEYDWVDNIIKTNTSDAILDEDGNEITPSEEFLGIAESNIIPLLVAAVKELKARVETLEANNV
jgi:hypothetical protein